MILICFVCSLLIIPTNRYTMQYIHHINTITILIYIIVYNNYTV